MQIAVAEWCAVWVAYGADWERRAAESIESFRRLHPRIDTFALADHAVKGGTQIEMAHHGKHTAVQRSRNAKIGLDTFVRAKYVLYLDADTEVCGDLDSAYIAPLRQGYDFVATASINQGARVLHHVEAIERETTLREVGYGVQLQAGAFAFAQTPATRALFATWREEWTRFEGQDQGALMRALARSPVRLWLLSRDFNGGTVVKHRSAGG